MDGEASRPADGEGDDLGDVLGGHLDLAVELLGALPGLGVGDVGGQFGRDGAGLDDGDPDGGLQLLAQRLGPPVDAPLRGGIDAVGRAGDAAGDRGELTTSPSPPALSWSRKTSVAVMAPSRLTSIMRR